MQTRRSFVRSLGGTRPSHSMRVYVPSGPGRRTAARTAVEAEPADEKSNARPLGTVADENECDPLGQGQRPRRDVKRLLRYEAACEDKGWAIEAVPTPQFVAVGERRRRDRVRDHS